nr:MULTISPECIES: 4-hydroxythreonine-4-phosphate dehydrogenase [unclassified Synechococcus]
MLRWLLLGLLIYGLGTAFKNGWLEVQWQQLFEDAGLGFDDSEQPLRLHEHPILKPPPAPTREP